MSEELAHNRSFPPLSCYLPGTNWNLKEYLPKDKHPNFSCKDLSVLEHRGYEPFLFQDRLKSTPNLPFEMSQLFDQHLPSHTEPSESSNLQPKTIRSARVEMTTPSGLGCDGAVGISGLPSNDLQEYVKHLSQLKIQQKYPNLMERLHPSSLAAIGVIIEELSSDLMETWRKNLRSRYEYFASQSSFEREQNETTSEELLDSSIRSELPSSTRDLLISMGGLMSGPLEYSTHNFERYAKLQIQGADISNLDHTLQIVKNRLEVTLFVNIF